MSNSKIYCFRANYERSRNFNQQVLPDWLCLETDWQGYKISTVPWVADVARIVGALQIEDDVEAWILHLESLGLKDVQPVTCEDWFEDRCYY